MENREFSKKDKNDNINAEQKGIERAKTIEISDTHSQLIHGKLREVLSSK